MRSGWFGSLDLLHYPILDVRYLNIHGRACLQNRLLSFDSVRNHCVMHSVVVSGDASLSLVCRLLLLDLAILIIVHNLRLTVLD